MRNLTALLAATSLAFLPLSQPGFATEPVAASDVAPPMQVLEAPPELEAPSGAEQDYTPNPAIWKLSDEDTTIYMFGTIHILPPGFEWRSDRFNQIVSEVDELVLETSDADSEGDMSKLVPQMAVMMLTRKPTSKRLTPSNGKKWLKLGRMVGMAPAEFDRMPLVLSMMGIGLSMSMMEGSQRELGVETILTAEFEEMGKPIGSIENSGDVMMALMNIDENGVLEMLETELTKWDGKSTDTLMLEPAPEEADGPGDSETYAPFAMEHGWAKGEVGTDPMFDDSAFGMAMTKVLLEDRNRAWAEWLDKRLDTPGTMLLAVGAGHFEGEHSVLLMLEKRGLTAERIN